MMVEVEEFEITQEDLLRTRRVLAGRQCDQEQLASELDAAGLTGFVERADWLIAHRTPDEQLVWCRRWARLGLKVSVPKPAREKRMSSAELLDEAEWLLGNGLEPWEVSASLGRSRDAVSRLAYKYGRTALGTRMQPSWAERTAA